MAADVHIAARVPADLASEFRRVCAADDRPVSQELRRLIRRRVDEEARNDEGRPPQAAPVQAPVEQDRHGQP